MPLKCKYFAFEILLGVSLIVSPLSTGIHHRHHVYAADVVAIVRQKAAQKISLNTQLA
jgi:hypothetical protein